jgi:hypothetical protein
MVGSSFAQKCLTRKWTNCSATTLGIAMGVYRPPDGITNLKYKLLYFLTPNKKNSKRKALAFDRDRCCHLAICLWLILFHRYATMGIRLYSVTLKTVGQGKSTYTFSAERLPLSTPPCWLYAKCIMGGGGGWEAEGGKSLAFGGKHIR